LPTRYYYYFVSTFSKPPSWGKYLTQLQMVQFVLMNAQAVYILVVGCPYPARVTLVYVRAPMCTHAHAYTPSVPKPSAQSWSACNCTPGLGWGVGLRVVERGRVGAVCM
jgi:hypothetical protein